MTAASAASRGTAAAAPRRAPTRSLQIANLVAFQAAWFAAVLGAAHQQPLWGTACVIAVIGWHLAVCARPAQEARLVLAAGAIGAVFESFVASQGHVAYPSGQPLAGLAPYWMVALWAELAIALNVTLRWLKRRWALAALLGALGGPLAFLSGVRLGGATLLHPAPALLTLAIGYAVLLPALVALSDRCDGVVVAEPERAGVTAADGRGA